ncbi:MAG: GWxTD domain-containing protein [Bacteroidales bacterium]|jgi:GWxTD domain-containing protein|nr:GWxTD domain-containing protein [Bacteroidales bacterium]
MRKIIIFLVISFFSVSSLSAKDVKATINYLLFSIPKETNYIEFQCLLIGSSIEYAPINDSSYQGRVNLTVILSPIDTGGQTITRKYSFITDTYPDSVSATKDNLYNLLRIPIANGEYLMKIIINDSNNKASTPLTYEQKLIMDYQPNSVSISDVQLISNLTIADNGSAFTKHNIDFIPYFSFFYPENITQLIFMTEIYNTDKIQQDSFVYRCYLSNNGSDYPLDNKYLRQKKCKKTDMHVILHSFDIDSLPSGNYHLTIEIFSVDDSLLTSKNLFFQRSNPDMSKKTDDIMSNIEKVSLDTLLLYLDYIYVIADSKEKEFIRQAKKHTYEELDAFFATFWTKRYYENPLQAWYSYYRNVMIVNNSYSTNTIKGYRTDRGYVFLKYGPPNEIEKHPFTQEYYPYEIWYYYNTANQNNVYFIFYSRDLVTSLYELIHSTARDEIYDPRWKLTLKAKDARPASIEDTE